MNVLLAEDEARIASFIVKGLRAEGFDVDHVTTGAGAQRSADETEYDLVIIDLGLPDIDGIEVIRRLRESGSTVPVIVLTARAEIADRVRGLESGADDYVTKPFAFEELVARVRARLRSREAAGSVLRKGDIALDMHTRIVRVSGQDVELTARESTLLETFLRHHGEVLSRERLLTDARGLDFDPGSNVVDVYVGYLRRKIGEDRIGTVRGAGYRLL